MRHLCSLFRAQASPGPHWYRVPCVVLHKYDTYAEARLNLSKASGSSSFSAHEKSYRKGKRKKKSRTMDFPQEQLPSPPASMLKRARYISPDAGLPETHSVLCCQQTRCTVNQDVLVQHKGRPPSHGLLGSRQARHRVKQDVLVQHKGLQPSHHPLCSQQAQHRVEQDILVQYKGLPVTH
ncbi:hypothetical protein MRX96_004526 [Rhipicephalus microplus]